MKGDRRSASAGISILALFLLAQCCGPGREPAVPADLLLTGASVYTLNDAQPWAEAVAVGEGKIVAVGKSAEMRKFTGQQTRVFDLAGKMVLPGLHDSHIHLVTGGMRLAQCDLTGLETQEEVFSKIRRYASENSEKAWIVGGGWELPLFPAANPTKEALDNVVSDRPVYLSAADGHSAWVNSRALELAGVTFQTPDPKNGRIERKPGTREPSGTLREAAKRLISRHIPEPSPEDYLNGLRAGLGLANRFGITSIIEASADDKITEVYAGLERNGELTLRVLASLDTDPRKGPDQVAGLVEKRNAYQLGLLRAEAAKIFIDGVIESHTAALLEPYLDRPGDRGEPILEQAAFDALAVALDRAGFQIHIHAIGDRAVRMSLDALQAARTANGPRDSRHHIAHLELIDPADVPRFKSLGVAANFQTLWAYPDSYITELTEPILGPERSRRLYPIGSVARSGALLVGGSDWSVSSLNPLEAIQVAVTRRALEDAEGEPWLPGEVIDFPTALRAYTINGAFLSRQETVTGSIEVGKAADLVVLDRNLFAIPARDIHRAEVLLTVLAGKIVYDGRSI